MLSYALPTFSVVFLIYIWIKLCNCALLVPHQYGLTTTESKNYSNLANTESLDRLVFNDDNLL